jgi:hypothetical protein
VVVTPVLFAIAEPIETPHASMAGDAASELAVDVNAATQALDDLKRSLRRQFPDPVPGRLQMEPTPCLGASPTVDNNSWVSPTKPSALALQQAPVASRLPATLVVCAAEPRRLPMLGLLAGIALSAVTGVLLYIYMVTR